MSDYYNFRVRKILQPGSAIPGKWSWVNPNVTVPAGASTQRILFTPDDTVNYNSVTADVSVSGLQIPLSITSSLSARGRVGKPFRYRIAANNAPTSYKTADLPSGLSVNRITGIITGTPRLAGTFSVNVSAGSKHSGNASATLLFFIERGQSAIIFKQAPSLQFKKGRRFTLTATSNSRVPIKFASSDQKIISISGRAATIRGKGLVTITATQEGNANYFAAKPVSRGVKVQ